MNNIEETNKTDAIKDILEEAQSPTETVDEAIFRLSRLPELEYEQARDTEAKQLNIRVSALDKEVGKKRLLSNSVKDDGELFQTVQPWPDPVNGAELLNDIQATIKYYIICNDETAIATTLWIAFTWFVDQAHVAPIAMITAPEKRCGKTQLLSLIGKLSARPLLASNISPAAIFRVIEAYSPTLLIDEADSFLKENEEARGIINSGHTRTTAHVIRVVGDTHEPKQFSTWGAKAICGIGKQAETLMDRSVILELRRKLPHQDVRRLRHAEPLQFEIFKSQLARFSQDMAEVIKEARPLLPESLNDRAQDNWEPLLAIADCAGGSWSKIARNAALKIAGKEDDSGSVSTELLQDIKEIFDEKMYLKIKTRELLDYLCEDDLRPWVAFSYGKPMTPRQLAMRLSEYGIKPKTIRFHGTAKGYEREQFEDVWERYIPSPTPSEKAVTSVTPSQNPQNAYGAIDTTVTDKKNVTVTQNPSVTPQGAENSHCYGVTSQTPYAEEIEERLSAQQLDGDVK